MLLPFIRCLVSAFKTRREAGWPMSSLWLRKNATHRFTWSGSAGRRGIYRDTVISLMTNPSFVSSALMLDTRCAPAVLRHRADEVTNLGINPRSAWIASARDPSPVSSESIPIPPRDCVCVDDDQAARPRRPRTSERDRECAVDVSEEWTRPLLLERHHLLPQGEVFPSRGWLGADRSCAAHGCRVRRGR